MRELTTRVFGLTAAGVNATATESMAATTAVKNFMVEACKELKVGPGEVVTTPTRVIRLRDPALLPLPLQLCEIELKFFGIQIWAEQPRGGPGPGPVVAAFERGCHHHPPSPAATRTASLQSPSLSVRAAPPRRELH